MFLWQVNVDSFLKPPSYCRVQDPGYVSSSQHQYSVIIIPNSLFVNKIIILYSVLSNLPYTSSYTLYSVSINLYSVLYIHYSCTIYYIICTLYLFFYTLLSVPTIFYSVLPLICFAISSNISSKKMSPMAVTGILNCFSQNIETWDRLGQVQSQ